MSIKKEDFDFYPQPHDVQSFFHMFGDLFKETFDKSWLLDYPNNQRTFSITPGERFAKVVDDKSVTYQFNEDFFRGDNFKKNHDGKHILFSGCSETEGVGGNIEDAWSHILYNKISKEEKCSGFFNLARSGWGWSRIIINALIYFKKYGYPDTYFILLPNHQRKFYYEEKIKNIEKIKKWIYYQTYPKLYLTKDPDNSDTTKTSTPKEYLEDFVFFLINWKTFCELCKSNNVKLIFSTWDSVDSDNLQSTSFDEFFNLENNGLKLEKYFNKYYQTHEVKKDDHRKRDGHSGRVWHSFCADQFYEQYKKRDFNVK
jgi:hypothetical protein